MYAAIPFLSASDGKIFVAELDLTKNVPTNFLVGQCTHQFQQLEIIYFYLGYLRLLPLNAPL